MRIFSFGKVLRGLFLRHAIWYPGLVGNEGLDPFKQSLHPNPPFLPKRETICWSFTRHYAFKSDEARDPKEIRV